MHARQCAPGAGAHGVSPARNPPPPAPGAHTRRGMGPPDAHTVLEAAFDSLWTGVARRPVEVMPPSPEQMRASGALAVSKTLAELAADAPLAVYAPALAEIVRTLLGSPHGPPFRHPVSKRDAPDYDQVLSCGVLASSVAAARARTHTHTLLLRLPHSRSLHKPRQRLGTRWRDGGTHAQVITCPRDLGSIKTKV